VVKIKQKGCDKYETKKVTKIEILKKIEKKIEKQDA